VCASDRDFDALAPQRPLSEAVKHNRLAHAVLEQLLGPVTGTRDERRFKTSLPRTILELGQTATFGMMT
jgi:hypothetical protein